MSELERLSQLAQKKISSHIELDTPVIHELADWRQGIEQLRWFVDTTITEILKTASTLTP